MSDRDAQRSTITSAIEQRREGRQRELQAESLVLFESMVASGSLTSNNRATLTWDDTVWVYRARKLWFCELRGAKGQVLKGSMFRDRNNIRSPNADIGNWMRCFIVHRLTKNPSYSPTHIARYLQPMRWLSDNARQSMARLQRINQGILERLLRRIASTGIYGDDTLYQVARDMVVVLNWTSQQRLLARAVPFKIPIVDPCRVRLDVTTKAFAEHREKKYPDRAFIDAVTAIKHKLIAEPTLEPKPGYDWIRVHTIPFMLAMGLRLGEITTLPLNALFEDEVSGKSYLRVWTEKGQEPTLRYVPKLWAPAVKESYRALLELCHPARALAKKIETDGGFAFIERRLARQARDPKDIDRLGDCGFDADEYFYTRELSVLGLKHNNFRPSSGGLLRSLLEETGYSGRKWQKVLSVTRLRFWFEERFNVYLSKHYRENVLDERSDGAVRVNASISSSAFHQDQPLHKHLIVVFDGQFDASKGNVNVLPMPMLQRHVHDYYTSRGGRKSVFERLGILDRQGVVFRVTPHQFRHWVTTSLQREGANDMAIDRWMGREIGQNRHYDHRTGKERAEAIRETYLQREGIPSDYLGRKVIRMRLHDVDDVLITQTVNEFISVAHFTPWGFCSRDLAIVPCNRSLQCLKGFDNDNPCRHFHLDPSDTKARENIERLLKQYEHQLRILVPEYDQENFDEALNLTEPLDQHIHHAMQIVLGCRAAIGVFESCDTNTLVSPRSARKQVATEL